MIVSVFTLLCLSAPSAAADSDFVLTWRSGEMSRDASHFETVWTLKGSTLTQHGDASGHGVLPDQRETDKTFTVTSDDVKKLAELLAAVEDAAKKHRRKDSHEQGRYTQINYTHGKQSFDLYFPYWIDDEIHRPKNESPTKLQVLEKLTTLRAKLYEIGGPGG